MNQEHERGNGKIQAVEVQSCAPDVSGMVGAFRRRTRSGKGRRAGCPPGSQAAAHTASIRAGVTEKHLSPRC